MSLISLVYTTKHIIYQRLGEIGEMSGSGSGQFTGETPKRQSLNHSPGPVIRELVPSSHQRSELNNTILCIFSR